MRRLRVRFAIVAALVAALIGGLIYRSLQSIALETQVRQQAIAERIFDEMERGLSQILAAEEARSTDRFADSPTNPDEAFIVSRFDVLARGPGARQWLGRNTNEPAVGFDEDSAPYPSQALAGPPAGLKAAPDRQEPGTTVALGELRSAEQSSRAKRDRAETEVASAYDALRSLNKAVEARRGHTSDAPRAAGSKEGLAAAAKLAPAAPSSSPTEYLDDAPFPPSGMRGHAVRPDRVVLYRSVMREHLPYHQGVVLDIPALGAWLRARSIGEGGLAHLASVEFFTEIGGAELIARAGDGYVHRFAAPFTALFAHLRLQSLARGGDTYTYLLAVFLLGATAAALVLLYRAVAVAVRYAERRADFVAAVSHELKTPLTAIRMYGEMLRDGIVPSEAKRREYYGHITGEAERLSRLIDNVLEHAKIEKGNRVIKPIMASVVPTVEEIAETMRPHAAKQGFELRFESTTGLPAVRFDPDALKQVLWNLLDNAIKYAAGAADRVILVRVERDGENLCITVRDRGPGVAAAQLGQIFDPFVRGESEHTRRSPGAGLGLSLVRSLVDRMGATVQAHNPPDGGFAVEVRFPIPD